MLLNFNIEKYKSLHFSYRNTKSIYSLGGDFVKTEDEENDLGIIVAQTLKFCSQCVANKT